MADLTTAKRKRSGPATGRAGRPSKCSNKTVSRDIRLQTLTALNFVGGVQFLVRQARKKNNAPFMALLAKCLQQDDGSQDHGITFVIKTINVTPGPVAGVLNSPIVEHVQPIRLVANGGEVIDVEPIGESDED
jgi:hypothetical protein